MPAPNSVTDSSRLSDLAPKARMDEIPDSGSLSSQRRFAELQATPGSHAPGVILNGGRLKRDSSCRGFGGAPSSKNSLESPFDKGGRVARQVQQDAAGVRGVPEIPAPRFHEDKLRGNDTRRAGTGACPYGGGRRPAGELGCHVRASIKLAPTRVRTRMTTRRLARE